MAAPYPIRPGEADCRDYLRTGRCKYGDSCKYNHPLNVESGGGVKPTNPSEPLFPIRPTEPACQYFLKHGTCKFGQSCKFNHPRGSALTNGGSCIPAGQLVFVTTNPSRHLPGDATSHLMTAPSSVQVLPQRPTEPNCIYFLRNGKCKYGATCKFHHPLDAMNRNNQVQFIPTSNVRTSQNSRDWSLSSGSVPEGRPPLQVQHNGTYATAATNISYVQPQRLQPITERVRPQQPTHILLPDGQIAVILDQQSLQNVSELSVQDRPKFYLSQTDGSIGTLPPMDHTSNNVVVSSPMLTATTNSTSTHTFDSSLDLMGNNASYPLQVPGTVSRGPNKSGSGGSLSAYGSLDSEFCQPVPGHNMPSQQQPSTLGQPSSFPQYSAWPITEVANESNLTQMSLSVPGGPDVIGQHLATNNLKSTDENTAAYYWPSSSSITSMPVAERDVQAGLPYISKPNSSPYGSSSAVGQAIRQSYSGERMTSLPNTASSDHIRSGHANKPHAQAYSGDNCEGLTMMTSALLTMMDRHGSPPDEDNVNAGRSPTRSPLAGGSRKANMNANISHQQSQTIDKSTKVGSARAISCQSEPNLRDSLSPIRPPPGMMSAPPGMSSIEPSYTSNYDREQTSSKSPPGGGYFLGGYDQVPPRSPPWGN